MACREGIDPADFLPGVDDPVTNPLGAQLIVLDATAQITDAQGHAFLNFEVGVDNINFTQDITFVWGTTDGTAVSSGANKKFRAVSGQTATIKAGVSSTTVSVPVYGYPPAGGAAYTGKYTMTLTISSPTNATILTATATGTIDYGLLPNAINPDDTPGLTIVSSLPGKVPEGLAVVVYVYLTPASGGTVTVNYATVDGTAHAGTDYTAASGTLTFAAGQTLKTITIQTLNNGLATGDQTFNVNLSGAAGAAIVTGSLTLTISDAGGASGGLPTQFTGWPDNQRVTYDEFNSKGGGGCPYHAACTGFAGAAVMSALAAKKGKGRWRFNAQKLYSDPGCPLCTDCQGTGCGSGCSPGKVPSWLGSNGAQLIDTNPTLVSGTDYSCVYRDVASVHQMYKAQSAALTAGTMPSLINKIKQAIYDNGAIYMASIFYGISGSDPRWNSCRASDGYVLRKYTGNSSIGHAWTVVGWDDSVLIPSNADASFGTLRGTRVGCFRVQSSHGCNWGLSGRGYIPYSYLTLTWPGGSVPRYLYWKLTWVG